MKKCKLFYYEIYLKNRNNEKKFEKYSNYRLFDFNFSLFPIRGNQNEGIKISFQIIFRVPKFGIAISTKSFL